MEPSLGGKRVTTATLPLTRTIPGSQNRRRSPREDHWFFLFCRFAGQLSGGFSPAYLEPSSWSPWIRLEVQGLPLLRRRPSSPENYHEDPCWRRRRNKATTRCWLRSLRPANYGDSRPSYHVQKSASPLDGKSPTNLGDLLLSLDLSGDLATAVSDQRTTPGRLPVIDQQF